MRFGAYYTQFYGVYIPFNGNENTISTVVYRIEMVYNNTWYICFFNRSSREETLRLTTCVQGVL